MMGSYCSSPDRVLRLWLVGGERLPLFTHLLARVN